LQIIGVSRLGRSLRLGSQPAAKGAHWSTSIVEVAENEEMSHLLGKKTYIQNTAGRKISKTDFFLF